MLLHPVMGNGNRSQSFRAKASGAEESQYSAAWLPRGRSEISPLQPAKTRASGRNDLDLDRDERLREVSEYNAL